MTLDHEERAIQFAMQTIRHSTDWQQVQDALSNHDMLGPWLDRDGDGLSEAQRIIRAAEERLGDKLPADYA